MVVLIKEGRSIIQMNAIFFDEKKGEFMTNIFTINIKREINNVLTVVDKQTVFDSINLTLVHCVR